MAAELLPTARFVNHPDHRTAAVATLDVTMTSGTTAAIFPELATDEGLAPWRELEEAWIYGPTMGDTAVDVSTTVDRKVDALRAHVSQIGDWDVGRFMVERLAAAGEPFGYAYAETFRVISFRR
jgi:LmbE family N-acetylglucosaminyl deacetylase